MRLYGVFLGAALGISLVFQAQVAVAQPAPAGDEIVTPDEAFSDRIVADPNGIDATAKGFPVEEYKNIPEGMIIPPTGTSKAVAGGETRAVVTDATGIAVNSTPRMSFDAALKVYHSGRFDEAAAALQPLVEAGHHGAEELLGIMYRVGQGVPKNPVRAFDLLSKAAEANMPLAQHHLGIMYFTGEGVAAERTRALMWLYIALVHYPDGAEKDRATQDFNGIAAQLSRRDRESAFLQAKDWLAQRGEAHLLSVER